MCCSQTNVIKKYSYMYYKTKRNERLNRPVEKTEYPATCQNHSNQHVRRFRSDIYMSYNYLKIQPMPTVASHRRIDALHRKILPFETFLIRFIFNIVSTRSAYQAKFVFVRWILVSIRFVQIFFLASPII